MNIGKRFLAVSAIAAAAFGILTPTASADPERVPRTWLCFGPGPGKSARVHECSQDSPGVFAYCWSDASGKGCIILD